MPIFDLFSKRQKKLRGETPDVYVYDELPNPLRVQIVHIWENIFRDQGRPRIIRVSSTEIREAYEFIVNILYREYGVFSLTETRQHYRNKNYVEELVKFFLQEEDIEKALDPVELSFRIMAHVAVPNAAEAADNAIGELNARFKEHGVGYQFTNGEIIRVDSELIHSEVVQPALKLLNQEHYAGADS